MESNGTSLNSLAERIKAKTEQERQEMETLTRQQFSALSESLRQSSKTALSTTEAAILSGITDMEKNITSRCQSLGKMFNKKYLYSILLSAGILSLTVLTCWGLITLYQYRIKDLRREMAGLTQERDALEAKNTALWNTFKGLEPYQAEGKHYLLTPKGLIIRSAGTVGQREAWEIVRK